MKNSVRVAVTGAAGQIGYALLFRLASGEVFGPETAVHLQLLELTQALPALDGVKMELEDCAFPNLASVTCTDQLEVAFKDADWALLVGSVPRKAGMERKDLLTINGGIFTSQGRAIAANAADDVRVLVVGNPCNTNCLIAAANAPEVPRDRWFAMTMLDENRGRSSLAQRAGVAVSEVRDLAIWGNHSSTQFPDADHAAIGGRAAPEVIADEAWLRGEFISGVQQRGAEIIKARGQSSAASAERPSGFVTRSSPWKSCSCGGVTKRMRVGLSKTTSGARLPKNVTRQPSSKFRPSTTTSVPPRGEPSSGENRSIEGPSS